LRGAPWPSANRPSGPQHPRIALSLGNLARVYGATGRCAEAEPLHQRCLEIIEKALPPDHPHLVRGLRDYAVLLDKLGRAEEAIALRSRADVMAPHREQR
jgi:tetratricopeptide (TPR) repeat protein